MVGAIVLTGLSVAEEGGLFEHNKFGKTIAGSSAIVLMSE